LSAGSSTVRIHLAPRQRLDAGRHRVGLRAGGANHCKRTTRHEQPLHRSAPFFIPAKRGDSTRVSPLYVSGTVTFHSAFSTRSFAALLATHADLVSKLDALERKRDAQFKADG
jgi:hypothetical protein